MIFLLQFGINQAQVNLSKTKKIRRAHRTSAIWSLKNYKSAYSFQIAGEKSLDYFFNNIHAI